MDHVVIQLKKPITLSAESAPITELRIRNEVVAGDVRGVPMRNPMDWSDLLKIAGRLAAQPDAVMNKLSMVDLAAVAEQVIDFLGIGPATGSEPSA
jgi:hypothetical protein